jgi:hypothetical protein
VYSLVAIYTHLCPFLFLNRLPLSQRGAPLLKLSPLSPPLLTSPHTNSTAGNKNQVACDTNAINFGFRTNRFRHAKLFLYPTPTNILRSHWSDRTNRLRSVLGNHTCPNRTMANILRDNRTSGPQARHHVRLPFCSVQ